MVVAYIQMLEFWKGDVGNTSRKRVVLEIQSRELRQVLNCLWNDACEGIK